jgi:uncharacterized protein (TIGR02246 family)
MGEPVCVPKRNRSNGIPARAIRGRLSLFMIALGCSGSDGVAPARADADAGPSLAAVADGGDIRGIEQLVEKFEAGFASKNAVTYASVYAEDADFVNPIGIVTAGRAAITTLHAGAFAGGFGPATLTAELRNVQFLTGTIALVDIFTTLSNTAGPHPPFAVVSPDGAVRARARWLAQKRGGEWEILISYHRGWWNP